MKENNPIKKKVREILKDPPQYRRPGMDYLRYLMKNMDQEELIGYLRDLNLEELRMAVGCGVPGTAMLVAHALLRKRKKELAAIIEKQPTPNIEADEIPRRVGGRQKITKEPAIVEENPNAMRVVVEKHGWKKVYSSETRREEDS